MKYLTLPALALFSVACATTTPSTLESRPPEVAGEAMSAEPWKDAAAFTAMCDDALKAATTIRDSLEAASGERTTENTLQPYAEMLRVLDTPNGWAGLMSEVAPLAEVREAADTCKQRLSKFGNDVTLNRKIYDGLAAVDLSKADAETKRAHDHMIREFKRSGVDKDEDTRARLKTVFERMVVLGQDYAKNTATDVRFIEVTEQELAGLPADWIDAHRPKDAGKFHITTDYPDYIPLQTYAKDGAIRHKLATEFAQRGFPANKAILEETLRLRWEYAHLLGFPNWAEYYAADKMVKTASTIDSFLKQLTSIARPRSERDTADLLEAKQHEESGAKAFGVWDRFYYLAKVREQKYGFDAQEVRNYFPYTSVKDGVLGTYAELFDIEFVRATDVPVWSPEVEAYRLRRAGKEIGVFFLDMHPRKDKFKHAAMFPIQTGLAGGRVPMAALECNFPDPKDGDALMEHSDVETFFHEFGHLLHHLLASGSHFTNLGGISVEWDFVEAPSQILQEWSWSHEVLARFAKHVKTGEVIPKDLVDRMKRSDEFGKGSETMRQLFYAAYSYFMHAEDPSKLDLETFTDTVFKEYSPYPRLDGDRLYCNFGHLMGYTSAYYTYQWSLVIAKDLFTRFEKAGIMDKATAKDYADKILVPGGTEDSADLVEHFLGRPYNLDAYRTWLTQ